MPLAYQLPELPCVHKQEPHNLIKAGGRLRCPWCHNEELAARLRKAEALIVECRSGWETTGYAYFRQYQLQMQTLGSFLDAKPQELTDASA